MGTNKNNDNVIQGKRVGCVCMCVIVSFYL